MKFFSGRLVVRVGGPTRKLLREIVRAEKAGNKKLTASDVVRRALIREGRRVLGRKADEIIAKGVEVSRR